MFMHFFGTIVVALNLFGDYWTDLTSGNFFNYDKLWQNLLLLVLHEF